MSDRPAPGRLDLLIGFVNTRDDEEATDALGSRTKADAWLAARGLPGAEVPLAPADLERLVDLREALRVLLRANTLGEPPPVAALEALNREGGRAPIGLRFEGEEGGVVATGAGVDAAIAELLAVVHDSMRTGQWSRLKVCGAHDCIWAFYDHSRNRSATWCRMEECGNRAKARAYRERGRAGADR